MDDFIEVRVITYIKHRNRFIQHIKNFIKNKQIKMEREVKTLSIFSSIYFHKTLTFDKKNYTI